MEGGGRRRTKVAKDILRAKVEHLENSPCDRNMKAAKVRIFSSALQVLHSTMNEAWLLKNTHSFEKAPFTRNCSCN